MYIPIIGAFLEAAGTILEKKILKTKINYKDYMVYEFLAIVLVMLPLLYFFWNLHTEAFQLKNILIFSLIIIFSILANLCLFYSIKNEALTEVQPARLMQPLFTILLAFLFFTSERKLIIVTLALIASLSLIFAHIKRHHLSFNKYFIAAVLSSLFFALELVISNFILQYYSSITFYFLRCLFVLGIVMIIFRPKFKEMKGQLGLLTLLIGAIWTVYRIILYYGYSAYGVIFTTTVLILAPVLIIISARIFFKEKIAIRQIISTAIIIVCVSLAVYLS